MTVAAETTSRRPVVHHPATGPAGRSWTDRLVTPLPTDRVAGWVVTLLVGGFAAFMRFWHLGSNLWLTDPTSQNRPPGYFTGTFIDASSGCVRYYQDIFDETYYHHDALSLLKNGVEQNCQNNGPGFVVHPPLGKWMIGAGIHIFGDNPFGWRFASALVGTLSVIILVRLARRLFGSTLLGGFAGLLLALDGMEFVQSRVAILDIFVMFFELAALATLLLDREHGRRLLARRLEAGARTDYPGPRLGFRYWRLATGVLLGAGLAVKWSGLYVIPAYAALAFAWDVGARRTANIPRPVRAAIRRDWLGWVPQFTLLPVAVYTATWTGWFLGNASTAYGRDSVTVAGKSVTRLGFDGTIRNWLAYQCQAYNFHKNLTDRDHYGDGSYLIPGLHFCQTDTAFHAAGKLHPYLSKPLGWLVLSRPVSFYYESPKRGQAGCKTDSCSKEILDIGTPAIWWVAVAALLVVLCIWLMRRDWRAGMIVLVFAFGFFPWMLDEPRQMFLFYALPILPVIVLAITMVAGVIIGRPDAGERRRQIGALGVGAYLTLVVVNFFWLYPLLVGTTLSYSDWHARIWFPGWI
ncbi:MAG TPA: glycosyltransferase family 39 protein [Mycobacteriales bacterium]|nr:glycosyltransferase family 39 protein [Mycobacteriales bacterium]